jgi:hypothetical protein
MASKNRVAMKLSLNVNSPNREIWYTYTQDVNLPNEGIIRSLSQGTLRAKIVSGFAEVDFPERNSQEIEQLAARSGKSVSVQILRPVSFSTDPTVDKLISTLLDLRYDASGKKDSLTVMKIDKQLMAAGIVLCPGGETIIWPKVS